MVPIVTTRVDLSLTMILIIAVVSWATSGCRERTLESRKESKNIYVFLESLSHSLQHSERQTRALRSLQEIDPLDVLNATLNDGKINSIEQVVFLAVADDQLNIPGVTFDVETRILKARRFVEIPGCGDDKPFLNTHERREWYAVINAFAAKYNSKLVSDPRFIEAVSNVQERPLSDD